MVVRVWKCRSVARIEPFQDVPEEGRNIVNIESGVVFASGEEQVLRQRQLPLAEDGVGERQQFLGSVRRRVGHVALAADRQEQRMHAGRIDGMDRVNAGNHGRE